MTATEQRHKQLWNAWAGQTCEHLNRYNTICTTKGVAYVSAINDMWIQPAFDVNVALKHFLGERLLSSLFIIIKTAGTYIKMTPFHSKLWMIRQYYHDSVDKFKRIFRFISSLERLDLLHPEDKYQMFTLCKHSLVYLWVYAPLRIWEWIQHPSQSKILFYYLITVE